MNCVFCVETKQVLWPIQFNPIHLANKQITDKHYVCVPIQCHLYRRTFRMIGYVGLQCDD